MHNVPVLPESLPSVALSLPGATKLDNQTKLYNMFVNTIRRQFFRQFLTLSKLRSAYGSQDSR